MRLTTLETGIEAVRARVNVRGGLWDRNDGYRLATVIRREIRASFGSSCRKRDGKDSMPNNVLGVCSRDLTDSFLGRGNVKITRDQPHMTIDISAGDIPYAAIHEYGHDYIHPNIFGTGKPARIVMPQRPFIGPGIARARPKLKSEVLRIAVSRWVGSRRK